MLTPLPENVVFKEGLKRSEWGWVGGRTQVTEYGNGHKERILSQRTPEAKLGDNWKITIVEGST